MEVDYDRRGNQVRRGDTNLAYTSFDKPHTFESANDSVYFTYGPGTERIRRLSSVEDRTYAGGLYERVNDTDAHVTKHHYKVPGSTGVLAEMTIEEGFGAGEKKYTYVAPDELGSSTVVLERGPAANSALTVKERLSYGPWGNRRNPNDWRQADSGNASETTIGFTGHAEQETAGLIYMNARMYDPLSGRFVSADPIVPEPFSTDGWSRYVYVGNNPVGYTDPSGHNKDDEVEAKAEAPPPPPESVCNMVIDAGAGTAETSGPDCGGPAQEPVDEVSSRADKTGGGGDPPPVVEQNDKMDTGLTRFAQATSGGDATTDAGSSSGTSPAKTDAQKLREMYGGRPFQGKDYSFGYSDVLVGTGHLDAAAGVFADYHTAVMFVGESAVAGPATKVVLKSAKAFTAGAKVATRAAPQAARACFVAGTLVLAEHGAVPIEKVSVGDFVWAYDAASSAWKLSAVEETFRHEYDGDLVTISFGETVIVATTSHPFCVVSGTDLEARSGVNGMPGPELACATGGRWVAAGELSEGDEIAAEHRNVAIVSLSQHTASQVVFNLEVAGAHTYVVSTLGLLVHNKPAVTMLGANGTKVMSKTVWKGQGRRAARIDVENPAPGVRPGQIHFQQGGNKHLYDPATGSFPGAPNSVNQLLSQPAIQRGIDHAMKILEGF